MYNKSTYLVLGGGGMIGTQLVHEIASELKPTWIMLCSRRQKEVRETIERYRREFPHVLFIPKWGDIFLRKEWNSEERQRQVTREQLLNSPETRNQLYQDVFHDLETAYSNSLLAQLILEHRPEVIIDSINTATAISYQDITKSSHIAKDAFEQLKESLKEPDNVEDEKTEAPHKIETLKFAEKALDTLLINQSIPQLIRHTLLLHRAMCEAGTRLYLKIGTTGTGGMGINIPYTHSEDKPSATLMTKTAIAFAHTGLMFLMARTPDGPIVKELKPGAMVGYSDITCRTIHYHGKQGKLLPLYLFESKQEPLGKVLLTRQSENQYEKLEKMKMVVVDTGENGVFTHGEFETITNLWQMEYVTPEEIARQAVLEIKGSNTGYDVIAAIDGAVMNPSYRAGYIRHVVLDEIARLEKETRSKDLASPSVALGQLGPPELGKLLWEAYIMQQEFGTIDKIVKLTAHELSDIMSKYLQAEPALRQTINSVGLPILIPDGSALIRGPFIRIPEVHDSKEVDLNPESINKWADKGWVDLRPQNLERWRQRFLRMQRDAQRLRGRGSSAMTREAYLSNNIQIGAVVAWIFNNEILGYRIK